MLAFWLLLSVASSDREIFWLRDCAPFPSNYDYSSMKAIEVQNSKRITVREKESSVLLELQQAFHDHSAVFTYDGSIARLEISTFTNKERKWLLVKLRNLAEYHSKEKNLFTLQVEIEKSGPFGISFRCYKMTAFFLFLFCFAASLFFRLALFL